MNSQRIPALVQLQEKLAFTPEPPLAARDFLQICLELTGSKQGVVFLIEPESGRITACPSSMGSLGDKLDKKRLESIVRTGKPKRYPSTKKTPSFFVLPLLHESRVWGCLVLSKQPGSKISEILRELILLYAEYVSRTAPMPERLAKAVEETGRLVHDFRNIVSGLSGYAQILRVHAAKLEPKNVEEYAAIIEREADRLGRLAESYLSSLRGQSASPRREKQKPAEVIGEVHSLMAADLNQRGIHLLTRIESTKTLHADPDLLQRALINLLVNAREALPNGGVIEIAAEDADSFVEFRVSDSGPGIPAEIVNRIFHSQITRGKTNGTGLGLRIVKDVAEIFGGSVRLEKSPFGGTSVVLSLPT